MDKKILFVLEFAGFIGGTERFVFNVASLLKSRGYACDILYNKEAQGFEIFKGAFNSCIKFDGKLPNPDEYEIRTIHRITDANFFNAVCENLNATLFVHDHLYFCPKGYKYYPYRRLNCKRAYCKMFCGICSTILPLRHFKDGIFTMLKRNFCDAKVRYDAAKKCKRFAVISNFMMGELIKNGVEENSISIVKPFLKNPEIKPYKREGKFKILFAGQFVVSKGITLLIDALKQMKEDFELEILGDGLRADYFKKIVKDAGVGGKVNFCGFVNKPEFYYEKCDVVVFPSLWQEPFGLVGIEAMAYAKPVVGFDVGGVSEWLKDGQNGLLIKERDTSSFAAALDCLAKNDVFCKTLGENAQAFVKENFTEEKFLKSFLELK